MIGIYKITNDINNKIYIGQSICIERRFRRHLKDSESVDTLLYLAMRKYGKEHFNLKIIEECSKELLNEKEIYYIKHYNSMAPNGYNMQPGGQLRKNSTYFKFSITDILEIYDLLLNTDISMTDIANEYDTSATMIGYINNGFEYSQDGYKYPIRDGKISKQIQSKIVSTKLSGEQSYRASITEEIALLIINDLENHWDLKSVDIAKKYNTTIDVVKDINRGKSWKYLKRQIPCRPDFGASTLSLKEALEIIKELKNPLLTIADIQKKHNQVSISAIYKINSGETWEQPEIDYPIRKYKTGKGKISIEQALEIINLLQTTSIPMNEIAKKYSISSQSVSDINKHHSYKYLTEGLNNPLRSKNK